MHDMSILLKIEPVDGYNVSLVVASPDAPGTLMSCWVADSGHMKRINRLCLVDRAYETIKENILDQRLLPGSHLNIDEIAKKLGVSSSPVREALARLSSQRLVRLEPFIGFFVEDIPDVQFYRDLMELRILIECYAARVGAPRKLVACIKAMEEAVRAMENYDKGVNYVAYRGFNTADVKFHQAIIRSAANRVLEQSYLDLYPHLHIARLDVLHGLEKERIMREHVRILEAFREGNAETAERALREHLEGARERLLASRGALTAPEAPRKQRTSGRNNGGSRLPRKVPQVRSAREHT